MKATPIRRAVWGSVVGSMAMRWFQIYRDGGGAVPLGEWSPPLPPGRLLDKWTMAWLCRAAVMAPVTVTFEELDREHREERLRDAERLRTGEITPEALQEENSLFSMNAKIIFDLVGYLKEAYPLQ